MNKNDKLPTIQSLDDLFSKINLYVNLEFCIYELQEDGTFSLNKNELNRFEECLGFSKDSIDSYCLFCGKVYPFSIRVDGGVQKSGGPISLPYRVVKLGQDVFISLDNQHSNRLPSSVNREDLFKTEVEYIDYQFVCKKNYDHEYKMYFVAIIEEGSITLKKIGQFPSKIDIWGFGFEQYRNQLNRINAYSDLKKAELCMSDGLSAGAYTYLRRVFEKMLNEYCKGKELADNRVKTKIETCIDRFDERVKPLLKNLHSILSAGIHELNDEQSEKYYVYLRTVIEMQLEYAKEIDDRDKQTKELKQRIDDIIHDLN